MVGYAYRRYFSETAPPYLCRAIATSRELYPTIDGLLRAYGKSKGQRLGVARFRDPSRILEMIRERWLYLPHPPSGCGLF
jgi:hypothetical protein